MAITITATVGSGTANSYVTEAEFIAYVAARPNVHSGATTSGASCTEAEKAALVQAQRELSVLEWAGSRVDRVQALAWPRAYVVDPDFPWDATTGAIEDIGYYAETVVPTRVKDAQCEVAIAMLVAGTTDLSARPADEGILAKTIGPLSTTYAAPYLRAQGIARFPLAQRLIAPLLGRGNGGLRLTRA